MTQVALTGDPTNSANVTYPISPIVVNSETLSSTNPDGVVHVDATQAQAGETSTITVTATDPATNTTTSQSFLVTVAANTNSYTGLTLAPVAFGATQTYTVNTPQTIQLQGSSANSGQPLTYAITTQPTHGTISNFNATTGTLTYTPNPGFQGNDSFQFTVTNTTANSPVDPRRSPCRRPLSPTAAPVTATIRQWRPTTIQLAGSRLPRAARPSTYASRPSRPRELSAVQRGAGPWSILRPRYVGDRYLPVHGDDRRSACAGAGQPAGDRDREPGQYAGRSHGGTGHPDGPVRRAEQGPAPGQQPESRCRTRRSPTRWSPSRPRGRPPSST